jgi:hypothetical protein
VDNYSIADVIKPYVGEVHIGQRIAHGRMRSWAHPYPE